MDSQVLSCPVEEQYRPPPGFYDFPYVYVDDYSNVVAAGADPRAGTTIYGGVVLDHDSDFLLRRVNRFAIDSLDNFQLYSPRGDQMFSVPVRGDAECVFPMVPEVLFQRGSQIQTEIQNWASSTTLSFGGAGPFVYVAQTVFQGVKRFRGDRVFPVESSYRYRPVPYSYRVSLNLNWTYLNFPYAGLVVAEPRRYFIDVLNADFELQRISAVRTGGAVLNNVNSPSFRLLLKGPSQKQMMRQGVYMAALNQSLTGNSRIYPCFPVPPVTYPQGSVIEYEIISHLDDPAGGGAPATQNFDLIFQGIRRRPC